MSEREALEAARHALVTVSGLWAHDGHPDEQFRLDESKVIAQIDAVLVAPLATKEGVRVTIEDLSGEQPFESYIVKDDYYLLCAGTCHVDGFQTYANGTHVITIKGRA